MNNYNKLLNNLELLKLDKIRDYYPKYIEKISKNDDISITDILYELTTKELEYRDDRASQIQITVSAFPFKKEISDFDFPISLTVPTIRSFGRMPPIPSVHTTPPSAIVVSFSSPGILQTFVFTPSSNPVT